MGTPAILINKNTLEILKDGEYPRYDSMPVNNLDENLQWLIKVPADAPPYDATIQVATYEWVKDTVNSLYVQTWDVRVKTDEELIAETNAEAEAIDNTLDPVSTKLLLQQSLTTTPEEDLLPYTSVYPAWKVGIAVKIGEFYQYKEELYKVVQAHTTQLDWTPDIVPALFVKVAAAGTIPVFVHPTGAHDVYMKGDKVHFPTISDPVYESLIDNNSWSPTEYPAGWKKL